MNASGFVEATRLGLEHNTWKSLDEWIGRESSFSYNSDNYEQSDDIVFDELVFNEIISLLSNECFLNSEGSSHVLRILEYDWKTLSGHQKATLLPAITTAFTNLSDSLSVFIVSELLGEYYCSESSFKALKSLRNVSEDMQRALIPVGLYYIAKTSTDQKLARLAHDELVKMNADKSEQVRAEVIMHLAKLKPNKKR